MESTTAIAQKLTGKRDANGYVHMNPQRNLSRERLNAGVDMCIAFMFGVVGFIFSIVFLYIYPPLGFIGIPVSLFFCLYYSYKASRNGGKFGIGLLIVAADLAFLTGGFIMAVSSVGP